MNDAIGVSLVFVLVFLNGFFVAAEFAIVKVRETRVSELASEGGKRAQIAVHILEHLDACLSALPLRWCYLVLNPSISACSCASSAAPRLMWVEPAAEEERAHSDEELRTI